MGEETAVLVNRRGTFGFQVDGAGDLVLTDENVALLRRLWMDRTLVRDPGPGVGPTGAWHVACHLVAAGGVRRGSSGDIFWLEISHVQTDDTYRATVTTNTLDGRRTLPLATSEGRDLLRDSALLGFVEGQFAGSHLRSGSQRSPGQVRPVGPARVRPARRL